MFGLVDKQILLHNLVALPTLNKSHTADVVNVYFYGTVKPPASGLRVSSFYPLM